MRLLSSSLCGLLLTCTAAASAAPGHCHRFEARVVDQRLVEGCTALFCTAGTIDGTSGLRGTIRSAFDSFAAGPSTTPEPTRTLSFSLESTFTLRKGTLVTRETGITSGSALDPAGRLFAGYGQFIGGTGAYDGATGWLQFGGRVIDGLNVTDTMVGEICLGG
ncbi:MAG TPA: hypothetical protein VGE16_04290 [Albitalea sp.]